MLRSTSPPGASLANRDPKIASSSKLLLADGLFLTVMGVAGVSMDLLSYLTAGGPFVDAFWRNPLVIGVIEAHGLAALIGALVLAKIHSEDRALHGQLAAAHVLLGAANIAFFGVFEALGGAAQGIAVTTVHFAFAAANIAAVMRPHTTH